MELSSQIAMATDVLSSTQGIAAMALGVLFVMAKRVSNEKAGPLVSKIQAGFDVAGNVLEKTGLLCKKIAEILANVVKSDGFLGKP